MRTNMLATITQVKCECGRVSGLLDLVQKSDCLEIERSLLEYGDAKKLFDFLVSNRGGVEPGESAVDKAIRLLSNKPA